MHKRVVERLTDGRCFLLGDAAHLSSPLGGVGLNSALVDAADIAWNLVLVVRGAAKPSSLDSYTIERGLADNHVLEVSDGVHSLVMGASRDVRRRYAERAAGDPAENLGWPKNQPLAEQAGPMFS